MATIHNKVEIFIISRFSVQKISMSSTGMIIYDPTQRASVPLSCHQYSEYIYSFLDIFSKGFLERIPTDVP